MISQATNNFWLHDFDTDAPKWYYVGNENKS